MDNVNNVNVDMNDDSNVVVRTNVVHNNNNDDDDVPIDHNNENKESDTNSTNTDDEQNNEDNKDDNKYVDDNDYEGDDDYYDANDNDDDIENKNKNENDNKNDNDNNNDNKNDIVNTATINRMRDNMIAQATYPAYSVKITNFLKWMLANQRDWLTQYGVNRLIVVFALQPGESKRLFCSCVVVDIKNLLCNAVANPIVVLELMTPTRYMIYLDSARGPNNRYLSRSAYGNRRLAFLHLVRVHNRVGSDSEFQLEFKGVYRFFLACITQNITNDPTSTRIANLSKEGKEPLLVQLYMCICEWFLKHGTSDGVFAYCFLVLTWNLACQAGNTARINFKDVSWTDLFDSFAIFFLHSKTDQLGEESKYARHVYSNPLLPLVCPVLSLGLYLTCCFNTTQNADSRLFPGVAQDARFS
jgi:hypothetical protein